MWILLLMSCMTTETGDQCRATIIPAYFPDRGACEAFVPDAMVRLISTGAPIRWLDIRCVDTTGASG